MGNLIENIVRDYRRENFDQIPEDRLIRFLGAGANCTGQRLMINKQEDHEILQAWEKHFQDVGSPYVVQHVGKVMFLWKERKGWAV